LPKVLKSLNQVKTRKAVRALREKQIDQACVVFFGSRLPAGPFLALVKLGLVLKQSGQRKSALETAPIFVGCKVNDGGLVGNKVPTAWKA